MVLIRTAHELMEAFRPRDLRVFELPDESAYPLEVDGYLAWVETGGARVYLVFEDPDSGQPMGVVFRRAATGEPGMGQMCNWCFSFGSCEEIGLLTAEESSRRRVGVVVCRDLGCGQRLEEEGDRSGRNTLETRRRLLERIARFAHEALGMHAA